MKEDARIPQDTVKEMREKLIGETHSWKQSLIYMFHQLIHV